MDCAAHGGMITGLGRSFMVLSFAAAFARIEFIYGDDKCQ